MTIPDPLRSPVYESGGLIQQCSDCDWAQRGHRSEIIDCPLCGAELPSYLALGFGGLVIRFDGRNFDIYNRCGGSAVMECNDLPEVIQFMCKHAIDRRTGQIIADAGQPRRVRWRKHFSEHFFAKE